MTLLRYAPSIGSVGDEDDEDENEDDGEGTSSFVVGGGALDPSLTKALVRGVLAAVGALSRRRIAHRDVKPGNLLLTADGRVALADLGLAARWPTNGGGEEDESENGDETARNGVSEPATPPPACPLSHRPLPPAGTRWYRPPEALYGGPADSGPGADLWGAGCLLAEALGLSAPLAAGETDLDQVSRVSEALGGAPDPREWPGVAELPDFAALASMTAGGCCWGRGSDGEEGEEEEDEEREEEAGGAGIDDRSRNRSRSSLAARLPDAPASALDLLSTLLAYDPTRRGTAQEALAHAYFREPPLPAPRGRVAAAVAAVVEAAERDRARAQQQRRRRQQQQQQQ